jgi:heat shock protein HslJ
MVMLLMESLSCGKINLGVSHKRISKTLGRLRSYFSRRSSLNIWFVAYLLLFSNNLISSKVYADISGLQGVWILEPSNAGFFMPGTTYENSHQRQIELVITSESETSSESFQITLQGQCNNYGARLSLLPNGNLSYTDLITTSQYCRDWRKTFDRRLTRYLFSSNQLIQVIDELVLFGGEGTLRFNRVFERSLTR